MNKLCRFALGQATPRIGLIADDAAVLDLSAAGIVALDQILNAADPAAKAAEWARQPGLPRHPLASIRLLAAVDHQEVWAAGVTYMRSKTARMEESTHSANAYDRVYAAPRPELFFKSLPAKVISPGDPVGIRHDGKWNVPEPELVLAINSSGRIAGYSIGNDMSSRDIEGENLLYLPQAKVYDGACAVGPWIVLGPSESEARSWAIQLEIRRSGTIVFNGSTSVGQIKRSFNELADYLCRCQTFTAGVMLLTGTGIVPHDQFSLQSGDEVRIEISGIGSLTNPVRVV